MTDLPRLNESGSDEEKALVRAARGYEPDAASRDRLLLALGLTASTAITGSVAAAASAAADLTGPAPAVAAALSTTTKAALSTKAWVLIVGTALASGVGSYGLVRVTRREAPPQTSPTKSMPEHGAVPAHERIVDAPVTTPQSMGHDAGDGKVTVPSVRVPDAPSRAVPRGRAPSPRTPTLTDELTSLDAASKALREGNAATALVRLDAHDAQFVKGRLGLEAEALRIRVLSKLGRRSEARERARRFMAAHPQSLLAQRLRDVAEIAEPKTQDDNAQMPMGDK